MVAIGEYVYLLGEGHYGALTVANANADADRDKSNHDHFLVFDSLI